MISAASPRRPGSIKEKPGSREMPGNLNTGMGGLKMTKAIKMLKGFAQFALVLFAIWFLKNSGSKQRRKIKMMMTKLRRPYAKSWSKLILSATPYPLRPHVSLLACSSPAPLPSSYEIAIV
jgi:hypothetical protein